MTTKKRYRIPGHIKCVQQLAANRVEDRHQVASPPVEAALRGQAWEQVAVLAPLAEQVGFEVPAATFANTGHGNQLTVTPGGRRGSWSTQARCETLEDDINMKVDLQQKSLRTT